MPPLRTLTWEGTATFEHDSALDMVTGRVVLGCCYGPFEPVLMGSQGANGVRVVGTTMAVPSVESLWVL